jgi:hypothetical protein
MGREPCESRGSRTDLGAPAGEIPPGDSTVTSLPVMLQFGRDRVENGLCADIVDRSKMDS